MVIVISLNAQNNFQRTYGGTNDEEALCIQQTSDQGYIMCGYSKSFNSGSDKDAYVVKTNSNGDVQWAYTYGGINDEQLLYIVQTIDGGYIATGYSVNTLNATSGNDMYVLKIDANGTVQWTKYLGGNYIDFLCSVKQTIDNNFVVAGLKSTGPTNSDRDACIIKLDNSGNVLWNKTFGDATDQDFGEIKELSNGDLICIGSSNASQGLTASGSMHDALIIKTDMNGNLLQTFETGQVGNEGLKAITIAGNGDIVVGGSAVQTGDQSCYYTRMNSGLTNYSWVTLAGKPGNNIRTFSIQTTSNGSFITAMAYSAVSSNSDGYLMLMDSAGQLVWNKTYGGTSGDEFKMAGQATDGGYFAAGYSSSFGAGGMDMYLIKTDVNGNIPNSSCPALTFTPTIVHPSFAVANVTAPIPTYSLTEVIANNSHTTTNITSTPTCCNITVNVNSATVCAGSSATLTASGAASYVWSTGATTNSIAVNPISTTTYSVTGTDINGCENINEAEATVNPLPTATISGTTYNLHNNSFPKIVFTGSSGTPPYTFGYTINNGVTQTISTITGDSISVSIPVTSPTTYTYTLLQVQDSIGCSQAQNKSVIFTINPVLSINGINQNIIAEVFPNPFDNELNIQVNSSSIIKITDITGRELYNSIIETGTAIIETTNFITGIYFISITNNQGTVTKKLTKN